LSKAVPPMLIGLVKEVYDDPEVGLVIVTVGNIGSEAADTPKPKQNAATRIVTLKRI